MSHPPPPIERLAAADLMSVWPEDKGWPQDIGALAVLDGDRLLDADGRVGIDALREHVGRRLHRVPRFRQVLCMPGFGLGWPLWLDAPSFDIDDHVGVFPVPPPGDDADVLRACETLRRCALPRSRPLWEMWFLPGLDAPRHCRRHRRRRHARRVRRRRARPSRDDRTTVDAGADSNVARPSGGQPRPPLRTRRARARTSHASLRDAPADAEQLAGDARGLRADGPVDAGAWSSLLRSDRRLAFIRSRLDVAKEIAHAHDAKVNDVLLTAVARGYRALLQHRGERVAELVPAGLRSGVVARGATGASAGQCRRRHGGAPPDRRTR